MNLRARVDAIQNKADAPASNVIPVDFGRVVAFSRDGEVIGRLTMALELAIEKFLTIADSRGDGLENFGYACLYGWVKPGERIGYATYKGVLQFDVDAAEALLKTKPAPRPTRARRTRAK